VPVYDAVVDDPEVPEVPGEPEVPEVPEVPEEPEVPPDAEAEDEDEDEDEDEAEDEDAGDVELDATELAPEPAVFSAAGGIVLTPGPEGRGWKSSTPATPAAVPTMTNGARRIRRRTPLGGCARVAPRASGRTARRPG
jgi:hypothetical protein